MSEQWRQRSMGVYLKRDGECDAIVCLDGEIWRSTVCYAGLTVDKGEWDSRSVAMRNADGAIRRAKKLRDPCRIPRSDEDDEEELD